MPHIVVIGGGIAGLSAAWRLALRSGPGGPVQVTVVEAAPRFGGKIVTERLGGFLVEGGADSFAARKPRGVGLVRELGLEESLIPTAAGRDRRVHLVRGGRLVPMPEGLSLVVPTRAGPVARTPLLSALGKLRLALDLVLPAGSDGLGEGRPPEDESVADLLRRRFGAEYLERIAGPLLGGIHSTDPDELSVEAAFPRLAALERRHRSLILGVRRGRAAAKGAGPSAGLSPFRTERSPTWRGTWSEAGSAAARVSLDGGMGELVAALVDRLRAAEVRLEPGRPVACLEPASAGGWTVRRADGPPAAADAVVLAAPPRVVAHLLRSSVPELVPGLEAISHVSSATVSLGYHRSAVGGTLRGLGFLVPPSEGRLLSACTFSSEKFPGRAPEGHVLLRAFIGGEGSGTVGNPLAELDDDGLVALAREELGALLGVEGTPVLARVHRFVGAHPQYRVGHLDRVRRLEEGTPPGLFLAGCAYRGLGIPDCIASGERAADAALEAVAARGFTAVSAAH